MTEKRFLIVVADGGAVEYRQRVSDVLAAPDGILKEMLTANGRDNQTFDLPSNFESSSYCFVARYLWMCAQNPKREKNQEYIDIDTLMKPYAKTNLTDPRQGTLRDLQRATQLLDFLGYQILIQIILKQSVFLAHPFHTLGMKMVRNVGNPTETTKRTKMEKMERCVTLTRVLKIFKFIWE